MAVGESAEIYWTTSSTINSMEDWTLLDLGSGGFDSIKHGYDDSDNEVWILTRDSTSIPMKIAVSDGSTNWVPSGSDNWVDVRPSGGRTLEGAGHEINYGDSGSADRATWTPELLRMQLVGKLFIGALLRLEIPVLGAQAQFGIEKKVMNNPHILWQ